MLFTLLWAIFFELPITRTFFWFPLKVRVIRSRLYLLNLEMSQLFSFQIFWEFDFLRKWRNQYPTRESVRYRAGHEIVRLTTMRLGKSDVHIMPINLLMLGAKSLNYLNRCHLLESFFSVDFSCCIIIIPG